MSDEIDYKAVLADLESKKAKLETAIAGIRTFLDQAAALGSGGSGSSIPHEIRIDTFIGLSVVDAAKKYLGMRKKEPKSTSDIVDTLGKGGLSTTLSSVSTLLSKRAKKEGDIYNLGKGMWGLTEWYGDGAKRQRRRGQQNGDADAGDDSTEETSSAKDAPKAEAVAA